MSSTSNTTSTPDFHFQAILNVALEDYKKKTGKDLCDLDDPLASKLDSCNSLDSILNIFREQAKAFDEYRNNNRKLFDQLKPVVTVLHAISTNGIITDKASSVFPPAKAVFSGIRILLSTAKDVSKSYDSLVEIFECIENFLIRLKIYNKIQPTEAPAITKIVTQIMVELINVLALTTEQIKQGRFKKYAKMLLGLPEEKDIKLVLDRLDRLTRKESEMTVAQTYDVVCRLVSEVQAVMEDRKASTDSDDMRRSLVLMQKIVVQVNKRERDKSYENFYRWLSATDAWENQNQNIDISRKGTATWFTKGDIFKKWKSKSSLMWIHGLPGSGKSVLCSLIIEDIQAMCETGLATLAFFYFDFRNIHKQDARSLLSSLLIQLCLKSDTYSEILSSVYSNHRNGTRQPNEKVLIKCLKEMLNDTSQGEVYIVVDALDECPSSSGSPPRMPRKQVLAILKDLVALRLPHVHFCFTSRPEVVIQSAMESLAVHKVSLHEEDGQKQEISDYIEYIFSSDEDIQQWEEEEKEFAKNTLLTGAQGMFRWVECQILTLRTCIPHSVRHTLRNLPKSLDETYEQALRMIDEGNRHYAHLLFRCLVVSKRPLLVKELGELFAFEPNKDTISVYKAQLRPKDPEEFIRSTCSTLVTVVDIRGQKTVQFSHFSAKEYLTSDDISISKHVSDFRVLEPSAHTLFATACLRVLLHLDDSMHRDKIQDFPLASYAAEYWVDHAQNAIVSPDLKHEMECIFDNPHFAVWLRLYNIDDPTPSSMSSLHYSQTYPTPLYYAALCGFRDVAEHLIDARHGQQDINAQGGLHLTPLHAALNKGHPSVAKFLLERGADIKSRDSQNWTPLHKASYHGYTDVMTSLIDLGADLNAREDSQETPLYLASKYGIYDSAKLLLEHRADANHPDMHGQTPLHIAYRAKCDEIVGLLLDYGADVTVPDTNGGTLLHLASQDNYNKVIGLLLNHGVDVNSSNGDGWTALHFASWKGYSVVVRSLLDRGAEVNYPNSDGWAALHLASRQGYGDIIRLLLDRRADATYPNNLGQTPLPLALKHGHDHVVPLLLDHGVDVNSSNSDGWTALHFASWQSYGDVVELLLDRGANANRPNDLGRTPLHLASQQGHGHVVRLLLDHGVDVNPSDRDGWIPLHLASWQGYNGIVVLLLDRGANPNHSDSQCWTSLHVASLEGHNETVQILLDHGADPNHQNSYGLAPLDVPSWGYHVQIITGIVMPGLHCVLHRGKVITSTSGYYSIRFSHSDVLVMI